MDIGGCDQSEAQTFLCSRFALCNKTNIKCSPSFTKRKTLGTLVIKFPDQHVYKACESNFRFPLASLGIVNTYFILMTFLRNKYCNLLLY